MRKPIVVIVLLLAGLSICAGATPNALAETTATPGPQLRVVVTTSVLGDLVGRLVGDAAQVQVLMPPGTDPHEFSVSPAQAQDMRDADVLVVNGLGLEEGMAAAIEAAVEDGANVFEVTSVVQTIPVREGDQDRLAGGQDPHVWLDPTRMSTAMTALADVIGQQDTIGDAQFWTGRAEALTAELTTLTDQIRQILAAVPPQRRILVTNHDAFGYFAQAFDFRVVGTVIPGGGTLAEPSAADLESLVAVITRTGVPAIFAENISSSRLAQVVADEVGAEAGIEVEVAQLYSDSLGAPGGPAATYDDLMRFNASTIATALAAGPATIQPAPDSDAGSGWLDRLIAPFASGFTQRALLAGLLVSITCATVGVWVVLRSLAFMGDALAHGVIPGIAIAALVGVDLTIGAAIAALVTVVGISFVTDRSGLPEDTSTGLLFVGMLSLGVLIISRSGSFAVDVTTFLFGDVLGVTRTDLSVQAGAAIVAVVVSLIFYRGFVALSFDERKAELLGLRPRLTRTVLLALVAMTVVTSFRTVGSLLVFGLLVAPPAAATLLVKRVPAVMAASLGLGALSVLLGLQASYHLKLAGSAAMSGSAVLLFFIVLSIRRTVDVVTARRTATT
ncbi:MAG: zinc ABC transporter permease AztB [Euzebya sp.]